MTKMKFTDDRINDLKRVMAEPTGDLWLEEHEVKDLLDRLETSEGLLMALSGVLNLIYSRYKSDLRAPERVAIEKAKEGLAAWKASR